MIYGITNAVNLTDGLDGLAAGSAAMVFAAFVIIAFWQFRHPGIYHVLPAGVARPRGRRGRDVRRVRRVPVVERGAGAGVHGRRRLARARRRDGRARAAHQHDPAAADPRRPLRGRDPERDRAGDLVPGLPPAGAAHGADPPPLRGRRLARVHGDRALLAARRRCSSRSGSASSTPTSSTSPGCID